MSPLLALAWLPVAIWVYMLLLRGRFWLPTVRLPHPPSRTHWPSVAVIVPARDEAAMVGRTLPGLLAQRYEGPVALYLVDDCSEDGTAQAAGRAAEAAGAEAIPLTVVTGGPRPAGWVGKTWALEQGLRAATGATGATGVEYVLFTDADIHHPPDSLARLVGAAEEGSWDLVSLMARLRVATAWERLIVPAFVYFFSQLYPFRSVARRRSRTAAAAGGCLLVRRDTLERAGGVAAIAGAVIDDVALGRAVKRAGGATWLGYADDVASIRPYPRLSDLWDMVARSAYTQLRHSPVALAGTVAGLAVIYLGPVVVTVCGLAAGAPLVTAAGAVAWALLTFSYLPTVLYYRQPARWALTLPAAALLYGAMTVDSARRHRRGRGAAWKGRTYAGGGRPGPAPPPG